MKESAAGYGVEILRVDVKDLVFPGNLREIMSQVLETMAQTGGRFVIGPDKEGLEDFRKAVSRLRPDEKQASGHSPIASPGGVPGSDDLYSSPGYSQK